MVPSCFCQQSQVDTLKHNLIETRLTQNSWQQSNEVEGTSEILSMNHSYVDNSNAEFKYLVRTHDNATKSSTVFGWLRIAYIRTISFLM